MDETREIEMIQRKLEALLAGHYQIDRPLGEGGMAFVYLATDTKHGRQVAVKVLKPDLAASLGAERFLREIQITAKLQHPNILPLYDSGGADGLLYYVMPFVTGESLSRVIEREKQLPIHDAVQIAREVAEALAYAHSFGLIHRDIKPDNIMMSNGHAVVADFGIARAMAVAGGDKLTQTGMAVGTPAYMSPEQSSGDPGTDGRADIYSLGCMLYEMLVGQVPFTGPNAMAVMARHTMDHLTPPSIMRQTIPPELEDVVFRTMEKVPADRYRTAHETVEALKAIERGEVSPPAGRASQMAMRASQVGLRPSRMGMRASTTTLAGGAEPPASRGKRWALVAGIGATAMAVTVAVVWLVLGGGSTPVAVAGGLDPRDVAVLYFDDLSRDSSLGFLADGISEGLMAELGHVARLNVVSRNGVAQFRGSGLDRDSIARVLQAGTVVAGSVEPAGANVRVSLRLVDGNSGVDLERRRLEVTSTDLLAARDSVVGTVSEALRRRIGEEVRVRELQAGTRSTDAWTFLQRGARLRTEARALVEPGDRLPPLGRADSLLRLGAAADPDWLEPRIQLGWVALDRARAQSGRDAIPAYDRAIAIADSVLAREPTHADALELRGTARFHYYLAKLTENPTAWGRLLTGAREDLEAARSVVPNRATVHLTLSQLYYYFDDVASALISANRAYEADAFLENAGDVVNRLFFGLLDQEQFGGADKWCAIGASRFPSDPRFVICRLFLLATPEAVPEAPRAWRLAARLDSLEASAFQRAQARVLVGGILAKQGLADSARAVWTSTRQTVTSDVDPGQVLLALEAYARTLAGDIDEAIDLLKRAVAANPDHDFANTAGRYWWWRELRQHPRWREIAGR